MKSTVVFYHGKCPDGFGAALCAWLKFGDSAEYVPCAYGQDPGDVTGKDVYILDFSFEPEVLQRMDNVCRSLTLLDHHKTAQKKLMNLVCKCGKLHFNLEKSGARLAWEHFFPGQEVPELIALIEDRDLWVWRYEHTADFLAAVDALPFDFNAWKKVLNQSAQERETLLFRGKAMNEKFRALCESIADKALPVTLDGFKGLAVNATSEFSSDVGNLLATRSGTFGMVWSLESPETVKVSLRSNEPFEVEPIAVKRGGGGHPRSSAFRMPFTDFVRLIQGNA